MELLKQLLAMKQPVNESIGELQQFWNDVADGIFSSSVIGWHVEKLDGDMQSFTATLSAESHDGQDVDGVFTFNSSKPDSIHALVKLNGKEIINGDYGNSSPVNDDPQELVDMISHMIDDRFEQDDLDDPFGGDDY